MGNLRKYIEDEIEQMWLNNTYDKEAAADRILSKIIDPDYTIPKKTPRKSLTKAESYDKFMAEYSNKSHYKVILDALRASEEALSRRELSIATGYTINNVCGRVAELLEIGAIKHDSYGWDDQTKRKVELLVCAYDK